jgi:diguanylate cyclase (GGDEF)-like protein
MIAFMSLFSALDYIERNIAGPFTPEDVAGAAYLSVSHLNRLFARVFHLSPANYILKRRLCIAAKALATTDRQVTDIALDAQFSAPESFSRAFKRQFLLSPSEYRRQGMRFHDLHPPLRLQLDDKGGLPMMSPIRRDYDTEELLERILASKGTYILLADIDHLMPINENLGRAAGDAAIAAIASRIERSIDEGMVFFRTGGDEFTILTGSNDLAACEAIAQRIVSYGDQDVPYPGGTLKVTTSLGIGAIPDNTDDIQAAIKHADDALMRAKHEDRGGYRVETAK